MNTRLSRVAGAGFMENFAPHSRWSMALKMILSTLVGSIVWASLDAPAAGAVAEVAASGDGPYGGALLGPAIIDPCLGTRWQRMADSRHPGGPARMVVTARGPALTAEHPDGQGSRSLTMPPTVIRVGDLLLVEQRSRVLVAHLEAVALEPAAVGRVGRNSEMSANGPVIRVEASGAGQARWIAGVSQ
jgi:hypothetical protein